MPYDDETGERLIEVKFKHAWYGDILRKPGVHLIPISFRDVLPKSATILSVLEEDEFEEDVENEDEEIAKHAHKMKPIPLSELAKSQAKSAVKKSKRTYRRKIKKD